MYFNRVYYLLLNIWDANILHDNCNITYNVLLHHGFVCEIIIGMHNVCSHMSVIHLYQYL